MKEKILAYRDADDRDWIPIQVKTEYLDKIKALLDYGNGITKVTVTQTNFNRQWCYLLRTVTCRTCGQELKDNNET